MFKDSLRVEVFDLSGHTPAAGAQVIIEPTSSPVHLRGAFKKVRDLVNPYPYYAEDEQPGIHQGKALGSKLYKIRFGESATTMAGHSNVEMTNFYEEDPDDIEWKIAEPKLDLKADLKR